MSYTQPKLPKNEKSEVKSKVVELLANKPEIPGRVLNTDPKRFDVFYQKPILNRRGMVWDQKTTALTQYVTDYIAGLLLTDSSCQLDFDNILGICRSNPYNQKHDGKSGKSTSNRLEEIKAIHIWEQGKQKGIPGIGKILDYQVPLKDKRTDKAGKIDLLAYDEQKGILRILELKIYDNENDSLLRTVLEGETYKSILCNTKRTKNAGAHSGLDKLAQKQEYNIPWFENVIACPLLLIKADDLKYLKCSPCSTTLGPKCRAYRELCDRRNFPNVYKLAFNQLHQEAIVIVEDKTGFRVVQKIK